MKVNFEFSVFDLLARTDGCTVLACQLARLPYQLDASFASFGQQASKRAGKAHVQLDDQLACGPASCQFGLWVTSRVASRPVQWLAALLASWLAGYGACVFYV